MEDHLHCSKPVQHENQRLY